jgi:hypothetical protein
LSRRSSCFLPPALFSFAHRTKTSLHFSASSSLFRFFVQ